MEIYGKHVGDINPHKSQPWIYKKNQYLTILSNKDLEICILIEYQISYN